MALPVLAATLTTVVVFFPVTFLYGVSKFLFTALALAVALSLFASYVVAMTVVPLFCARFIKGASHHGTPSEEVEVLSNSEEPANFRQMVQRLVQRSVSKDSSVSMTSWSHGVLRWPATHSGRVRRGIRRQPRDLSADRALVLSAHRCRTIRHQSESSHAERVSEKPKTRSRKWKNLIRQVVSPEDLGMIVSNIGATPDFSAIYTTNSAMHTAFVQVSLKEDHKIGSYEYMARVKREARRGDAGTERLLPIGRTGGRRAESGIAGADRRPGGGYQYEQLYATALKLAAEIRDDSRRCGRIHSAGYRLSRAATGYRSTRAGELGLDQREVVGNVITALTSNQMIAPSFWIDPKTGNDYMLTVQYPETQVKSLADLRGDSLRASRQHRCRRAWT